MHAQLDITDSQVFSQNEIEFLEGTINNALPNNWSVLYVNVGSLLKFIFLVCFCHSLPDIPANTVATKTVEANSFIALMCNSTTADLVSDSLSNDLVKAVFANVPKLVPNLKGGYFAVKENSKELSELCFEPKKLLTIAELAQLYPGFRSAKKMPFFEVPGNKEHVKGIKVNLREDKALHGGTLN